MKSGKQKPGGRRVTPAPTASGCGGHLALVRRGRDHPLDHKRGSRRSEARERLSKSARDGMIGEQRPPICPRPLTASRIGAGAMPFARTRARPESLAAKQGQRAKGVLGAWLLLHTVSPRPAQRGQGAPCVVQNSPFIEHLAVGDSRQIPARLVRDGLAQETHRTITQSDLTATRVQAARTIPVGKPAPLTSGAGVAPP